MLHHLRHILQFLHRPTSASHPRTPAIESLETRTLFTGTWILDVTYERPDAPAAATYIPSRLILSEQNGPYSTQQTRQITIIQDL